MKKITRFGLYLATGFAIFASLVAVGLPSHASAQYVPAPIYNSTSTLQFTNVTDTQATVQFVLGNDQYQNIVQNQGQISIQYRPWGCGDDQNLNQVCTMMYIQPTQMTFSYQGGYNGGYSSVVATLALTNLMPGTKYRVWLGYGNNIQCFAAPCPTTTWNPEIYSFTTTSNGGSGGYGYQTTQLSVTNITGNQAQVSIFPGADEFGNYATSRQDLRVRYMPISNPIYPVYNSTLVGTAGYVGTPYNYPEMSVIYTNDVSHPLPVMLSSLTPNTTYRLWLVHNTGNSYCDIGYPSCSTIQQRVSPQSWTFTTTSGYVNNGGLLTEKLYLGVRSSQVYTLEQFLVSNGYMTMAPDTYFGTKTFSALRLFQQAHGLDTDGVLGRKTRALVNQLMGQNYTNHPIVQ